jgi:hypothetical protein
MDQLKLQNFKQQPHINHFFGHFNIPLLNVKPPFKYALWPLWAAIFWTSEERIIKKNYANSKQPPQACQPFLSTNWVFPSSDKFVLKSDCFSLGTRQSSHKIMWVYQQYKKLYWLEFMLLEKTPLSSRCQTKNQHNSPQGWGMYLGLTSPTIQHLLEMPNTNRQPPPVSVTQQT